jgi:isopenicillin N synthase-like dioxygenase
MYRAMNFGDFKDGKAQQPLPASLAPHESEIHGFAELCNKTCTRVLTLLSLGLEVRERTLSSIKTYTAHSNSLYHSS